MKKSLAILMALAMIFAVFCAAAEQEDSYLADFTGSWADPAFDHVEVCILPGYTAWSDDRMGETIGEEDVIILVYWSSSDSEYNEYRMTGTVSSDGKTLSYGNGMYTVVDLNEPEDSDDRIHLVEDMGKGQFTMTDQGTLKWEDSYETGAAEMELEPVEAPVPTADELAEQFFRKVAACEMESAGAQLKMAGLVTDLYQFCSTYSFWEISGEALLPNLLAAFDSLSDEEKEAFEAAEPMITEEALRLVQEEEELTGSYTDAGVEDQIFSLRNDQAVRCSVEAFAADIATMENAGEP